MIADLVHNSIKLRLITKNVMSVYSTNNEYTDRFILELFRSKYTVNDEILNSDELICRPFKDYNRYENLYRYVISQCNNATDTFIEYLSYLNLTHLLWVHLYELSDEHLHIVELLIQLVSNKPIIVLEPIENISLYDDLRSIISYVGLKDKLIIIPFTNIELAVNDSTCQCYVKSPTSVKIESRFPEEFINLEFKSSYSYYTRAKCQRYMKPSFTLSPTSYRYTLFEYVLIILFKIKLMLIIAVNNWRR